MIVTPSRASILLTLVLLLSFSSMSAQRVGRTETVRVPFRSESWSATAGRATVGGRREVTVAPPQHLSSGQIQKTGTTATGSASTTATSLVGLVFPGPVDENPPDSDIAAGPNHLIATVNAVIAIYDKKGNLISQTESTQFFGSVAGPGCCFDLRVLYDQTHGRFMVAAAQTDYNAPASQIVFAVSATSDPTGTWNKYAVNSSNVFWSDFPTIAVSESAFYITADRIPFSPGPAAWDITVIGIPELLSGSPNLRITDFANVKAPSGSNVNGPIIPAMTYGSSAQEYLVSNGRPGVLYVFSITTSGTPTLNSTTLQTTPYPPPPLAPQPGSSVGLGPGGDAIFTVVWRNGSLWVAQSVGNGPGTPAAAAVVRWYELDPATPSVRQLGMVVGVGDAYMPALTARADGQVDLVYTTSSTTQFASAGFAHRDPTDPPNTMSVAGIYKAGDSVFPSSRWGDISGIAPDPDGTCSWGIAEFATKGNFGTSIVQILSPAPPPPAISLGVTPSAGTVTAGQTATFQVAVTGQGLSAPVALACGQGLPSGAACKFSPAAVSSGSSSTLTISTTARSSAALRTEVTLSFLSAGAILLATRRSRATAALFCAMLVLGFIVSCGGVGGSSNNSSGGGDNGGGGGNSGTPAGNYAVTITATSGAVNGSTSLSLVVR